MSTHLVHLFYIGWCGSLVTAEIQQWSGERQMASTPLNRYVHVHCDTQAVMESLPHLMVTYCIFLGQLQHVQCQSHVWQPSYWLWLHRPWHNPPGHNGQVRRNTKLYSISFSGKCLGMNHFVDFQSHSSFCQVPMPVTTVHSTHSSLIPGTTYHYMFGDGGLGGSWSPEFSFTAPPPVGPNATTRVVAFGGEGYPCAVCILHFMSQDCQ